MLDWWLPENVSTYGAEIDWLFHLIYYITGATFVLVFVTMLVFIVMYRDRPGTASCFMRNCGTKKLWITSCDLRCTRTTLLTGTCISSRKTWSVPGYVTCQLNCFAVTKTSKSVGGTCILILDHAGTLRNVRMTRITAGTIVHAISRGVLPCVYRAVRPGRSR